MLRFVAIALHACRNPRSEFDHGPIRLRDQTTGLSMRRLWQAGLVILLAVLLGVAIWWLVHRPVAAAELSVSGKADLRQIDLALQ